MAHVARNLLVTLILVVASPLLALSPLPDTYQVRSPNGQYSLQLSRSASTQSVMRRGETKMLWAFEASLTGQEFFLSDDGTTVIEIARGYVRLPETDRFAVRLLRKGKLTEFPLGRMSSVAPDPFTPWLHRSWQENNCVFVHALDGRLSRFDLGSFELAEQTQQPLYEFQQRCIEDPKDQYRENKRDLLLDAALSSGVFVLLTIGLIADVRSRRRERTAARLAALHRAG